VTRILGIDPGTRITGYGVIDSDGHTFKAVDYGCIKPPPKARLSERYRIVFEGLQQVIAQHSPDEMAVENIFFCKNPASALKLGQVRGVILLAGSLAGVELYEYAPRRIKQALVGRGGAIKTQVQTMVMHMLGLTQVPEPIDITHALAVAICHGQAATDPQRQDYLV